MHLHTCTPFQGGQGVQVSKAHKCKVRICTPSNLHTLKGCIGCETPCAMYKSYPMSTFHVVWRCVIVHHANVHRCTTMHLPLPTSIHSTVAHPTRVRRYTNGKVHPSYPYVVLKCVSPLPYSLPSKFCTVVHPTKGL